MSTSDRSERQTIYLSHDLLTELMYTLYQSNDIHTELMYQSHDMHTDYVTVGMTSA